MSFGKAKSEICCFCDKIKSIVLGNYIIHDAQKKKLISGREINKRKVEKNQFKVSLIKSFSVLKPSIINFLNLTIFFCPMTGISVA